MLTLADAAALLVLLVLLHRTGALLSQITRLPTITICLVAGTVCHTCGVFTEQTASGILSLHHAALAVITFAAGSELELEALRANFAVVRSVTLGLTVAALLVVFVLSLPLLVACSASSLMLCTSTEVSHGTVAAMLAAVVAVARSPSSAIGVVRELQADGPFTQTMLTVTMVTDVAVIVLFTGAIEIADAALDPSGLNGAANGVAITARFVSRTAAHLVLSLGHGALLAALCLCVLALPAASMLRPLALYMVGGFAFLAERGMHHMLHGTPLDDLVKLEPMLSCIAAGFTLCNYGGRRHAFGALLTRCMPPTLIFFFVTAGISLDVHALRRNALLAVGLFLARLLSLRIGHAAGMALAPGPLAPAVRARDGWLAYVTQAGVSLGLAEEIGERLQLDGLRTALVGSIVLNQLVGPPLLTYALHASGEAGQSTTMPRDKLVEGLARRLAKANPKAVAVVAAAARLVTARVGGGAAVSAAVSAAVLPTSTGAAAPPVDKEEAPGLLRGLLRGMRRGRSAKAAFVPDNE